MSDPVELQRSHTRPDRTLLAIIVLAIGTLAGTIALLPGSEEKAEGLLAEGRYADAIQVLVAVENERPLDAYEGYLLFKLYLLDRQPDSAVMLLGQGLALQGDKAWALRRLSELYRETRNASGEASMLRQLYDAGPTDADFLRLRTLYRLMGDTANEATLLARAIAAGRSERTHIERLAYLRALPSSGIRAAVWAAPTGAFGAYAETPSSHALAQSDRVVLPTTPF